MAGDGEIVVHAHPSGGITLDAERPADVGFGLYPLAHTDATQIVTTLQTLVPERDQLVTLDKNQQPQVYDDVSKPPTKLSADERLNAVVAVVTFLEGSRSRSVTWPVRAVWYSMVTVRCSSTASLRQRITSRSSS